MLPYTHFLPATVFLRINAEIHKTPFDYRACKHATELNDFPFLSFKALYQTTDSIVDI